VTIGYLAARTSRIRFGTSVLVLPIRSAFVVAKQAATLHRLSGERVVLGLGAGWAREEFAAVGVPFEERGRRTAASLEIVRDLFEGRDRGGVFEPKLRAPLPIMIGGTTTPALRRAARFGDEWQGLGLDGAGFSAAVARLRSFGERKVKVGTRLDWSGGDPEPVVAMAHELAEAGAETVAVSLRIVPPLGAVTVMRMFGADATFKDPRVQVTTPEACPQAHPDPVALTNAAAGGSVSVTVSALAVLGPALATATV